MCLLIASPDMQRCVRRSIRVRARRVAVFGLLCVQLVAADGRRVEQLERLLGHQEIHVGDEAEILRRGVGRSARRTGEKSAERWERGDWDRVSECGGSRWSANESARGVERASGSRGAREVGCHLYRERRVNGCGEKSREGSSCFLGIITVSNESSPRAALSYISRAITDEKKRFGKRLVRVVCVFVF